MRQRGPLAGAPIERRSTACHFARQDAGLTTRGGGYAGEEIARRGFRKPVEPALAVFASLRLLTDSLFLRLQAARDCCRTPL